METIYNVKTIKVTLKVSDNGYKKAGSPEDTVNILRAIYAGLDQDQEHFSFLALDQMNKVRGYKVLFSGGQTSSLVDPKVLFRNALLLGAVRLIVSHNHPSGNPQPSQEDICLTNRLAEVGKQLSLPLLDHIILGGTSYWSFEAHRMIATD